MGCLPELLHAPAPDALEAAVRSLPAGLPVDVAVARAGAGDPALLHSLMRDYSVLVSAYLLEGKTKGGAPRAVVPANVAAPFAAVAAAVDEPTIMSYDSYCLSNCYSARSDAGGGDAGGAPRPTYAGWGWADLRLIRAFDGGPEEATFVLVHAEIESHTPALVGAYNALFAGLGVGVDVVPPDAGMPAAGSTLPAPPATPSAAITPAAVAQVQTGLAQLKDVSCGIIWARVATCSSGWCHGVEAFTLPAARYALPPPSPPHTHILAPPHTRTGAGAHHRVAAQDVQRV
jgi:hypothetical protein